MGEKSYRPVIRFIEKYDSSKELSLAERVVILNISIGSAARTYNMSESSIARGLSDSVQERLENEPMFSNSRNIIFYIALATYCDKDMIKYRPITGRARFILENFP